MKPTWKLKGPDETTSVSNNPKLDLYDLRTNPEEEAASDCYGKGPDASPSYAITTELFNGDGALLQWRECVTNGGCSTTY